MFALLMRRKDGRVVKQHRFTRSAYLNVTLDPESVVNVVARQFGCDRSIVRVMRSSAASIVLDLEPGFLSFIDIGRVFGSMFALHHGVADFVGIPPNVSGACY